MNPFIGQISMFAGNFAPQGWAFCDGQLLAISQHNALFSLLGTTYGGDGRTTFALPDLRGRTPIHEGHGPGLSPYGLGAMGGLESVHLTVLEMPSHTHSAQTIQGTGAKLSGTINAASGVGTTNSPKGKFLAQPANIGPAKVNTYADTGGIEMAAGSVSVDMGQLPSMTVAVSHNGGSQPHENRQPFLVINYIIALEGIYPSRS